MKASNSASNSNKLKDKLMIFIALIAVSVILLSAFLIEQEIRPAATPVVEPIQSFAGYYLSYGGNASKIFVVSTNASYGRYPYPTFTLFNGSVVKNGEPCCIINVTIRNDYSTQYPPPYSQSDKPTLAYVFLTAQIFNHKNQINAMDVSPPLNLANGGAYASLSSGENTTLTIYLATNNMGITSFQIVTRFIVGLPPP
jgi:hypothetical protein